MRALLWLRLSMRPPIHGTGPSSVMDSIVGALIGKALLGLLVAVLACGTVSAQSASELFRKGNRARQGGRHIEAYIYYSRARALDPANSTYLRAARGVRRGAAQLLAAAGEYRTAIEMAPDSWEFESLAGSTGAPLVAVELDEPPKPRPTEPPTLRYSDHDATFRFRGQIGEAYQQVATEFGVEVLFEDEFDTSRPVRADLTECDLPCALRALGEISKSFAVPVNSELLLVAPDDSATRSDLQTAAVATIPFTGALTPEEATEVGQAAQQVLEIKRFQASAAGRAIILRDSTWKAKMARVLIDNLLHPRAEVVIEVRILSVTNARTVTAGIGLPTSVPVTRLATSADSSGAGQLIGLGGGRSSFGIALGDASALATLNATSSDAIHTAQLRTTHGMPVEFHVGERYPIATGQYSSGGQDSQQPGYIQPPPSITFEDLGLNLTVTPWIHTAQETSLDIEANLRLLTGEAVNDVPYLSNRELKSHVRLRSGEFAIVSGMAVYEVRKSGRGPWGLGAIPGLGSLFSPGEQRWNQNDLIVLVRPRLSRLPPGEIAGSLEFLYGTEQRPLAAL